MFVITRRGIVERSRVAGCLRALEQRARITFDTIGPRELSAEREEEGS